MIESGRPIGLALTQKSTLRLYWAAQLQQRKAEIRSGLRISRAGLHGYAELIRSLHELVLFYQCHAEIAVRLHLTRVQFNCSLVFLSRHLASAR